MLTSTEIKMEPCDQDYTYCVGYECGMKYTCKRYHDKPKAGCWSRWFAGQVHKDSNACDMYIPDDENLGDA